MFVKNIQQVFVIHIISFDGFSSPSILLLSPYVLCNRIEVNDFYLEGIVMLELMILHI